MSDGRRRRPKSRASGPERPAHAQSGAERSGSEAPVGVHWQRVARCISDQAVRRAARAARDHGGRPELALTVVFVGDRTLARLHDAHLADPSPTDVITFDLGDDHSGPEGELYVSAARARAVARRRKVALQREISLYVVHGVLHLCGYDDHRPADRARMRRAERRVMDALGFAGDPLPHDE